MPCQYNARLCFLFPLSTMRIDSVKKMTIMISIFWSIFFCYSAIYHTGLVGSPWQSTMYLIK